MKINWNYIKGGLLIGLFLFLFGFTNHRNKMQKIVFTDIEFEQGDNLFMSYEMVNKLLIQNRGTVVNKAKSLIDLNNLEKQVLNHPMVENATAFLTVNGHLKISVKQRTPIGRINSKSASYYIDRLGNTMPLSKNYSARVPIVTGIYKSDNLEDLHTLLSFIGADKFLNKQIVGVHKMKNNEYMLMTRIGGHEIVFGKVENMRLKFKNLKAFYNFSIKNNTMENYTKINLKYNKQVVCTKK